MLPRCYRKGFSIALSGRQKMGMVDAEQFRKEAEECRREAERAINPLDKEFWLSLSREWIKLAQEAEKPR